MHSHDNQRDIGLFTHCGKTCMMAASGCTRQRHISLNTRQNSTHAYITKMVCACAQYQSGGEFDQMKTLRLPCCWCGWLLLSCEWTLEVLLNDKSNKPGVFKNKEKFQKQNVSATTSRMLRPAVPRLPEATGPGPCWAQFNLCRQEFAKQVSWLIESHKSYSCTANILLLKWSLCLTFN